MDYTSRYNAERLRAIRARIGESVPIRSQITTTSEGYGSENPENTQEIQEESGNQAVNLETFDVNSLISQMSGTESSPEQMPEIPLPPTITENQEEGTMESDPLTFLEEPVGEIPVDQRVLPDLSNIIVNDDTARFSAAEWYDKVQESVIVLAGAGGIGSWVTLLLAKLKPKAIYLYDPDIVEMLNMAGQLYGMQDIGEYKVNSLARTVKEYSSYQSLFCIPQRWTFNGVIGDVMICGFDNMRSRKMFYNAWKTHLTVIEEDQMENCLFIDGRLAAEELQVFALTGDDRESMKRYESDFLFSDEEAENLPCSFRQTAFMANMIGGFIVNILVNFLSNRCGNMPRTVPFLTSYRGDLMFMKIDM